MTSITTMLSGVLELADMALAFAILGGLIAVLILYVLDVNQTSQAIRRNYPVIGRLRYFFEHLGVFFRQYFFAMDREELPFNRAQRAWVARAAKKLDNTLAFGSTKPLNRPGDIFFLNGAFPPTDEEVEQHRPKRISFGDGFVANPYTAQSLFNISAMSFGALSGPAISALSKGAEQAGIWLNTGEGGLSPFHQEGDCDLVFQIGTAKYGVRDKQGALCDKKLREVADHDAVKMFEIKLSQGAKPGKGGILPVEKVTELIATTRGIPVGVDSISPNRHEDINSIDDLLEMIVRVREVTGKPVGIKLVLGQTAWLDLFAATIIERGLHTAPDFITIDSAEGGTGAAPQGLIDNVGLPADYSIPVVVDKLIEYGLRERIKVFASGKMVMPYGVAAALSLGADCVNSARGFMFALGCIQALQCNQNTCPTGITTHDLKLQRGLNPASKAVRVEHYAKNVLKEVTTIAHSCGVVNPQDLSREHAYFVGGDGTPQPLIERYPYPQAR